MSAKLITKRAWLCRCTLKDCPGKGKQWTSIGDDPPRCCRWCKRLTWNRPDQRIKKKMTADALREYNRQKQAQLREKTNFAVTHWQLERYGAGSVFCGQSGRVKSTKHKNEVTCTNCLRQMELHGHVESAA